MQDATRCKPRCHPSTWTDCVDKRQPKVIKTTCGKCGRFIGYRPVENETKKGSKQHDNEG